MAKSSGSHFIVSWQVGVFKGKEAVRRTLHIIITDVQILILELVLTREAAFNVPFGDVPGLRATAQYGKRKQAHNPN